MNPYKQDTQPKQLNKQNSMTDQIKQLVFKLDREVWANVPANPKEPWTESKAREESARLITEYFGTVDEARSEEFNKWQKVIEGQRKTLSEQYDEIQRLKSEIESLRQGNQHESPVQWQCPSCKQDTRETQYLGACSQECMRVWCEESNKKLAPINPPAN